jgi:hypothetical protein
MLPKAMRCWSTELVNGAARFRKVRLCHRGLFAPKDRGTAGQYLVSTHGVGRALCIGGAHRLATFCDAAAGNRFAQGFAIGAVRAGRLAPLYRHSDRIGRAVLLAATVNPMPNTKTAEIVRRSGIIALPPNTAHLAISANCPTRRLSRYATCRRSC